MDIRFALDELAIADDGSSPGDSRLIARLQSGISPALITVAFLRARPVNLPGTTQGEFSLAALPLSEMPGPGGGAGAEIRVCLSDGDWCGRPDDIGWAHVEADPRLINPGEFEERSPYGGDDLSRGSQGVSTIELANADRFWDSWLTVYSSVGLTMEFFLVEEGGYMRDALPLFGVEVGSMIADGDICRITPASVDDRLDVPVSRRTYGGRGGSDGDAELAGIARERCFGYCEQVPAEWKDRSQLRFSFHDGKIKDFELFEKLLPTIQWDGVDHATEADYLDPANDPSPGYYTKCTVLGEGRLGTEPAGILTANVWGGYIKGSYQATTGAILQVLTEEVLGSSNVNSPSYSQLPKSEVGIYIPRGSTLTVADVCSSMLRPFAANYRTDDRRRLTIAVARPPGSVDPLWSVSDDDRFDEGETEFDQPVRWKVQVSWGRRWRPVSESEAADPGETAITAAEVERAGQAEQWGIFQAPEVKLRFPLAKDDLQVRGYFRYEADAIDAAENLLAFNAVPLGRVRTRASLGTLLNARGGTAGQIQDRDVATALWSLDLISQTVAIEGVGPQPLTVST